MKRRSWLSWLGLGALAALLPGRRIVADMPAPPIDPDIDARARWEWESRLEHDQYVAREAARRDAQETALVMGMLAAEDVDDHLPISKQDCVDFWEHENTFVYHKDFIIGARTPTRQANLYLNGKKQ